MSRKPPSPSAQEACASPFWFALNANEMVARTAAMSATAVGCWLLLKCYLMTHPLIPKNPLIVQRICRGADAVDVLDALTLLREDEDGYRCPEIEGIKAKMQDISRKRSAAGKKGATAKWEKEQGWTITH